MALEKIDEQGKAVWKGLEASTGKIQPEASKAVIEAIVKPAGDGRS